MLWGVLLTAATIQVLSTTPLPVLST